MPFLLLAAPPISATLCISLNEGKYRSTGVGEEVYSVIANQTNTLKELIPPLVSELMEKVHSIPYNRDAISQENLNLVNKSRTSLFP